MSEGVPPCPLAQPRPTLQALQGSCWKNSPAHEQVTALGGRWAQGASPCCSAGAGGTHPRWGLRTFSSGPAVSLYFPPCPTPTFSIGPLSGLSHVAGKMWCQGTSLGVQWLRLCSPSAGAPGLIPDQGTRSRMLQLKILHATTKVWSS